MYSLKPSVKLHVLSLSIGQRDGKGVVVERGGITGPNQTKEVKVK
jgi:hypothetical protein